MISRSHGLRLLLAIFAVLSTGCVSNVSPEPGSGTEWVSRERQRPVTHIILHHTAADLPTSLRILSGRDPAHRVSCHYLVTDEASPRIIPIVPEDRVAFHAGVSHWRGLDSLNEVSIGIEIVHPDGDSSAYPEAQVAAVGKLVRQLADRHGVAPANILAHSDIAPGRKQDPGPGFDWPRLRRALDWAPRHFPACVFTTPPSGS